MRGTFSEEPGLALAGILPCCAELPNALCSVNVSNTFSFSKSSRTEKHCQRAAHKAWAFPDYISMFCNSRERRFRILPVAFRWNVRDKIQKHVCPSDMSLDSVFLSLVLVCTVAVLVMWFYSCSRTLTPCLLTWSRDGTRRTSEVKFKQDVREWISFRDKGGMPSSQGGFMIFGFVFLFHFSSGLSTLDFGKSKDL